MKYRKRVERLLKRQRNFDELDNKKGRVKPGSLKKTA